MAPDPVRHACPVQVKEDVYFAIYSTAMTAAEMASRIGLDPDDTLVKGSRVADPPLPRAHAWQLRPTREDASVAERVDDLLDRLRPLERAISDLIFDLGSDGSAVLQLVRYFNDSDGIDTEGNRRLGYALDAAAIELLSRLDAVLDVDEYDESAPSEP
jgi:hypothetical protein